MTRKQFKTVLKRKGSENDNSGKDNVNKDNSEDIQKTIWRLVNLKRKVMKKRQFQKGEA